MTNTKLNKYIYIGLISFLLSGMSSSHSSAMTADSAGSYLDYSIQDPFYSSVGLMPFLPDLHDQWGAQLLNLEGAFDFTQGSGVTVAVLDTGVYRDHSELQENIWVNEAELNGLPGVDDDGNGFIDDIQGWDFVNNDNDSSDDHGHGTHVAGILGALENGQGITGIAPEVNVLPIKVLDEFGTADSVEALVSNVVNGIRYAADVGSDVINMSLGLYASALTQAQVEDIYDAVLYARSLGSIIVASAGNDAGLISEKVPALFDEVISVGAITHAYDEDNPTGELNQAFFSNEGPELDFVAPGVDILSLAVDGFTFIGTPFYAGGIPLQYSSASGTSMSAPMVSGVIALMLSLDPLLSFEDIYRRLQFSSTDMGDEGFDVSYGHGLINAYEAISHDYWQDGTVKTFWEVLDSGTRRSDYYQNGRLERLSNPSGYIYTYFDEFGDFNEDGDDDIRGRRSRTVAPSGNEYTYEYWNDTDNIRVRNKFDDQGNPVWTRHYFEDTGLREYSLYYSSGNEYYYENQDFEGRGYGRWTLKRFGSTGTELRFTEYWPGTNTVKTRERWVLDNQQYVLTYTRTYYDTGIRESDTFDSSGNVYHYFNNSDNRRYLTFYASSQNTYEHLDEASDSYQHLNQDFNNSHGRYVRKTSADGSYIIYDEYWEINGQQTDMVKQLSEYDAQGNLLRTRLFDQDGNEEPQAPIDQFFGADGFFDMHNQLNGSDESDPNLAGAPDPNPFLP